LMKAAAFSIVGFSRLSTGFLLDMLTADNL